jgi:hypothetical protein
MSDEIERYRPGRLVRSRRSANIQIRGNVPAYRPPVCMQCGARNIRPFSSIYGHETRYYTTLRGLILKHGYERTRRQSVLAARFSPPIKLPWSPVVLLVLVTLLTHVAAQHAAFIAYGLLMIRYYVGWAAVICGVIVGVNNFSLYPWRIARWRSSFYCEKCGEISVFK